LIARPTEGIFSLFVKCFLDSEPLFSKRFYAGADSVRDLPPRKKLSTVARGVGVWHKFLCYNWVERKVRIMKMSLENGFLFLYDWMPILEDLPGESFKELLLALIDRQQNGTPMPSFSDPRCAVYYRIISATVDRRRRGQKGGLETKKRSTEAKKRPNRRPKVAHLDTVVPHTA